jgi:hypothetical protein
MRAKKAIRAAKTGRGTRKASVPKKAGRGASADTKGVAEYIAGIPESSRKTFDALRAAARQAAPKDAEEVISYGIVALRTEKVLVWYQRSRGTAACFRRRRCWGSIGMS